MSCEAMDDGAPILSTLWTDRHASRGLWEKGLGAREAPLLYSKAVRHLEGRTRKDAPA